MTARRPSRPGVSKRIQFLVLALLALTLPATAADWPMWRYDANRSAASPQELSAKLHLQWQRTYPPQRAAWPDQPLMPFDTVYEPVVLGHTMYLGSSRIDSVTAIDTRTGVERWRFHAEGPVRFAPVAWEGKVYFVSDDGYLYCIDAENGSLVWKFRGGPSDRMILGNERLISSWPARGAPVIADGTIYFAASIWPFMGIFIHALDARTGKVVWTNDGDGSIYIKQPHQTDAFAGVAPQGPLCVIGDSLLVPGGRSVPACFDRKTGKLLHFLLGDNSKQGGGSEVAGIGSIFINGGSAFGLATGKRLGTSVTSPVLTADTLYGLSRDVCRSYDLKSATIPPSNPDNTRIAPPDPQRPGITPLDPQGPSIPPSNLESTRFKSPNWKIAETGSLDIKGARSLIKAGSNLYAGVPKKIFSIPLPLPATGRPDVAWEQPLPGTPTTIIAADDRLFVATLEGHVLCFGPEEVKPAVYPMKPEPIEKDEWIQTADRILDATKAREGYCISWGTGSGRLLTALALRSKLHIIAIEPDAEKVKSVRDMLGASEFSGDRIAIIHADPMNVRLPPYLATLMVSEDLQAAGAPLNPTFVRMAFQVLRPFGGIACLPIPADQTEKFAADVTAAKILNALIKPSPAGTLLVREGALPGTDNWTHEHADASNSRVSDDNLVKAPLGMLWFGGPTNEGILPRHGHGPQPQVIDGRLIIEGVDKLRAIDIYTGRLLWESPLPGIGGFFDNLSHQPGANAVGTNYISTSDAIYVAYRDGCVHLDPATGRRLSEFKMPAFGGKAAAPRWGYINVIGDYLIGGADPLWDTELDPKAKKSPLFTVAQNDNLSASKHLVVMNRRTGAVLWTADARSGFRHNGVCAGGGRLYAIDRLSGTQLKRLARNNQVPDAKARILALALDTGAKIWESEEDVFGTWLSYSERFDIVVESGRVARDTLLDEPKGMRAFRGDTGAVLWRNDTYLGPAMLHGDTILKDRSACDLRTGKPIMRPDPLTGEPAEWTWVRNYGCNTPLASKHLMTFRSGAAGYLDLSRDGGTGNFGGFRSSCTNNLIVAGGVLCAPEYTRTCTCSYQNQTSLCMVSMPSAEMWTSFGKVGGKGSIRRVGINFGAPGDRKTEDGTLWLEIPSVGGLSPSVDVRLSGKNLEYFRHHSSRVTGPMNWVTASGVKGLDSCTLALGSTQSPPRNYTVRLYFSEPDDLAPGQRRFDVTMQGKPVLRNFDIVKEAGGPNKSLVKEFNNVNALAELKLLFKPVAGTSRKPLLCGMQVVVEK